MLLFSAADVSAAGNLSENSSYGAYEYVIDSYDVNMSVNENNTFDITEKIGAYFNVPKHGIIRYIPLQNKVERLDGTTSYNRAKVTDITVDSLYSLAVSGGQKVLKIGDADTTLTGAKDYVISYRYNLGRDTGKGYDEFYFNIIGRDWDTAIGNITFSITMPKEFDVEKLGFSRGTAGNTDSTGITYKVEGNVITGSYAGTLNPGEALTVRLELPEGYFTGASNNFDLLMILSFVMPPLFALLAVFMWLKFGKDKKVIETVEFYPPEGYNSAEIGFLYRGKADSNDVISLLVYLANKGYIKIVEVEEHTLFAQKSAFKLVKLKDYEGEEENERLFLNGLFSTAKKFSIGDIAGMFGAGKLSKTEDRYESREEVTSEELYNSFYITLNRIVQNLNAKENRQKVFEKTSLSKGIFVMAMIAIVYVLITIKPVLEYGGSSPLVLALLFPGIGFTLLFWMVFGNTKIPVKIFGVVWGLGFGGVPWATMVLPALMADPLYLAVYIEGIICVFVMVLMLKVMPKRTDYGNEILGRIRGFRTFLETAEKPKLEELVLRDPLYFYNILPFTYVLGVSDKWIRKFEVIALQAPDWYAGNSVFSMVAFGAFMNSTMSTASAAMSSSPSGGGAGGFSGGGSAGGGSGGGGGGSW
ncbi:DUF2207 domain-containing protein [Parasporobacterium paucivorans]|nr:DUF2207 domain-containing protein [Parasporobacterium paucivorans]